MTDHRAIAAERLGVPPERVRLFVAREFYGTCVRHEYGIYLKTEDRWQCVARSRHGLDAALHQLPQRKAVSA